MADAFTEYWSSVDDWVTRADTALKEWSELREQIKADS